MKIKIPQNSNNRGKKEEGISAGLFRGIKNSSKEISSINLALGVLVVFLSLSLLVVGWKYSQEKSDGLGTLNSSEASYRKEREAEKVLEELEEIFLLPKEDKPTVATIVDAKKLKAQLPDFYGNAQDGDKLIIFAKDKTAIIFRSEDKKVIKFAQVNIEGAELQSLQDNDE